MLSVSDALAFRCDMVDLGDGFDWTCGDPAFSFWLSVGFVVDGVPVEPLEVWRESGRVSFGRCLRGRGVEAAGVCRPCVVACSAASWRLRVSFVLADSSGLADAYVSQTARAERSAEVVLDDVVWRGPTEGEFLARLPDRRGVFVGVGALRGRPDTGQVVFDFHEGNVTYAR